jgi:hypothetical protein
MSSRLIRTRDATADIAYRVLFSSTAGGTQVATVRRVEGEGAAGASDSGQTIIDLAPVSTKQEARVTQAGEYRFFAGWRSDPYFFDTERALNNFQFTGHDFFAEKNVCSIVLEVPNTALESNVVGLWHWSTREGTRPSKAVLSPHTTPFDRSLQKQVKALGLRLVHSGASAADAPKLARGLLYRIVGAQAVTLGYIDVFRVLAMAASMMLLLSFIVRKNDPKASGRAPVG